MPGDPERFGHAAALLAGDLAAVLADRLLLTSGFDPVALARALAAYHEMRLDMAAGQLLDVAGLASDPESALRAARLKGGSYTVEGPLVVGAELAGAGRGTIDGLRAYGVPLGGVPAARRPARPRGAHGATSATVNELVRTARRALPDARIDPVAAAVLDGSHRRWRCHERRPRRPAAVLRRPADVPGGHGAERRWPHVAARWFVWRDDGLWVSTRVGDTTWEHAVRDPRLSVLIDRGRDWPELAGVRVEGSPRPILRSTRTCVPRCPSGTRSTARCSLVTASRRSRTTCPPSGSCASSSRIDSWDHR